MIWWYLHGTDVYCRQWSLLSYFVKHRCQVLGVCMNASQSLLTIQQRSVYSKCPEWVSVLMKMWNVPQWLLYRERERESTVCDYCWWNTVMATTTSGRRVKMSNSKTKEHLLTLDEEFTSWFRGHMFNFLYITLSPCIPPLLSCK